ncbi:glycosyltransferase [Nocardioides sp. W7]|uniref:glycosyltransferase family 2 protein n=1 Tax=Nocardioides sp. W7 TaxID=2931390 RepID=UPI001FD253B1|nr:glycosyltransferase [Nocardioides sp. W7]
MISVVVPVGGFDQDLLDQIEALAHQRTDTDFEVVISANTVEALGSLRATNLPPRFRVIDSTAVVGPSAARNAGWRSATGEVILFCDADDVVSSEWVQRLGELSVSHAIVGGPLDYDLLNRQGRGRWVHDWSKGLPTKFGHLPFLPSANLGVSRQLLEDLNGFNEGLRACEDTDLCWRAQELGNDIGFDPAAVVHYRLRTSYRATWRQSLTYGQYDVAFALQRGIRSSWSDLTVNAVRSLAFLVRATIDPSKRHAAVGKWGVLAGRTRAALVRPSSRRGSR